MLLNPKNEAQNGPTVIYALHKWLISIFSQTAEDITIHRFTQKRNSIRYLHPHWKMTSSATSVRLQIPFVPLMPSPTSPSQIDLSGQSQKLLELAPSKFTSTYPSIVFTFRLEMTSTTSCGRQQIALTFHFGSCSGRDFSITLQSIPKRFAVFRNGDSSASFSVV